MLKMLASRPGILTAAGSGLQYYVSVVATSTNQTSGVSEPSNVQMPATRCGWQEAVLFARMRLLNRTCAPAPAQWRHRGTEYRDWPGGGADVADDRISQDHAPQKVVK